MHGHIWPPSREVVVLCPHLEYCDQFRGFITRKLLRNRRGSREQQTDLGRAGISYRERATDTGDRGHGGG